MVAFLNCLYIFVVFFIEFTFCDIPSLSRIGVRNSVEHTLPYTKKKKEKSTKRIEIRLHCACCCRFVAKSLLFFSVWCAFVHSFCLFQNEKKREEKEYFFFFLFVCLHGPND